MATQAVSAIEQIKKRDGRYVPFDIVKISHAIEKAFSATSISQTSQVTDALAAEVEARLKELGNKAPEVEHIQDVVESVLIDNGYVQTAKAYILYRADRSRVREMNTRLMKIYEEITFSPASD